MKAQLIASKVNENNVWNQFPGFNQVIDLSLRSHHPSSLREKSEVFRIGIPSLEKACRDLQNTFLQYSAPYSAVQFIPILKKLAPINPVATRRVLKKSKTSHVLVQNDLIKVVLIHWEPGKISDIHGHPTGGCVFKVLKGSLVEKRYSTDESQQPVAVTTLHEGGMAYIDDDMALHAVGNPFSTPAISLHVYTPGKK